MLKAHDALSIGRFEHAYIRFSAVYILKLSIYVKFAHFGSYYEKVAQFAVFGGIPLSASKTQQKWLSVSFENSDYAQAYGM